MNLQESAESKAASLSSDPSRIAPGLEGKTLLNLGCGTDFHPAFVNVDLIAAPGVIGHDLRKGIPFPDATYDFVYHSTMLSHLRYPDALKIMRECCRVLKPGGILRVVTEDLEQMCRIYLQKLEAAWEGDAQSAHDYNWMMLELYDQASRESPGGGIAGYLRQDPLPNEAFIHSRIGEPGKRMLAALRARAAASSTGTASGAPPKATLGFRDRLAGRVRNFILTKLMSADSLKALEVGSFRLSSGQVTYRMYDRYSLKQLFLAAGFSNVQRRTVSESGEPTWRTVNLDVSPTGDVARPHALILEGTRPS